MTLENFKLYSTDDFILDDDFREIVRESDSNNRLKELLERIPEKRREINLAAQVIRGLHPNPFQQAAKKKQESWDRILQTQKRAIRRLYFRVAAAASLILLVGLGSTVFYFSKQRDTENLVEVNVPTSDDATLILANGKKVSISKKESTFHYSADGSQVLVNDSSEIVQSDLGTGFNQLIVPFGKRSYITLSEGTKVWLNSGSKLIFPPIFKGKTREVYFVGEGYFEVAKDVERPFFVKTDLFRMKVYGTRFNLESYPQDNNSTIVLVEGKVSMIPQGSKLGQEVFLAPSQKAMMSKGSDKIEIANVENTDVYTGWIEGYLTFSNVEVSNLLKRVSRYYNVQIETQLPDNIEKIYGKLDLKDEVVRVLNGIAFISKTKYEKRGDKYVFFTN